MAQKIEIPCRHLLGGCLIFLCKNFLLHEDSVDGVIPEPRSMSQKKYNCEGRQDYLARSLSEAAPRLKARRVADYC